MAIKLGIFGGSFDPIHSGHVGGAVAAQRQLGLDRVFFVPTGRPPHKRGRDFAPELLRYAMVEMALLPYPDLVVSDLELRSDRPSYTIDTVERFSRRHPEAALFLLMGADSFREIDQWVRWRELVAATTLVVLQRPGYPLVAEELPPAVREAAAGRLELVEVTSDASSTAIRIKLSRGELPPLRWLPAPVLDCCRKYALYR